MSVSREVSKKVEELFRHILSINPEIPNIDAVNATALVFGHAPGSTKQTEIRAELGLARRFKKPSEQPLEAATQKELEIIRATPSPEALNDVLQRLIALETAVKVKSSARKPQSFGEIRKGNRLQVVTGAKAGLEGVAVTFSPPMSRIKLQTPVGEEWVDYADVVFAP